MRPDLEKLNAFNCPPAIVLGVSWANGLGLMRSMSQPGVPVLALDSKPEAIGLFSRYATQALVCPDAGEQEEAFLDFMDQLGESLKQPGVLFLTRDQDVSTVSRNQERLERHFLVPFARWDVVSRILDKQGQYAVATEIGVPLPATCFPKDREEAARCAQGFPFPAILKPAYHVKFTERFGVKGFVARSADEAVDYFQRGVDCGYKMMIQEIIPGEEDQLYTYGSYLDSGGAPLAEFTGRKLRQYPRDFGTCRLGESCAAPEMAQLGLRMLHGLGFWGTSQVEFKYDARDGKFKLMEVNARNWQWQHLSTICGANFAYTAYQDVLGRQPEPKQATGYGRRWVLAATDLAVTPGEILRGRISLGHWLSSWRGVCADGIFSWHDPNPGWRYLRNQVGRRLRGAS